MQDNTANGKSKTSLNEKPYKDSLIRLSITAIILLFVTTFSLVIINASKTPTGNKTISNDAALIQNAPPISNDASSPSTTIDPQIANHYISAGSQNGNIADHIRGNANAKVIVIEYSDYQCPGCAQFALRLPELYAKYQNDVLFVSRNYPLSFHENARPAAMAAESAGLQGYYWQMNEALFKNQNAWTGLNEDKLTDKFVELFQQIAPTGNLETFQKHLDDSNLAKKIDFDHEVAKTAHKLTSTPSFYVNGERADIIHGTMDEAIRNLEEIIKAELSK